MKSSTSMLKKPAHPGRYKRDKRFPRRTTWNPRLPVSATSNRPPDNLWPIKEGTAVFYLDGFNILSGHVAWWNPSREIDASCVTSAGKPFFKVVRSGHTNVCPSVKDVFPYTAAGWTAARKALARALEQEAAKLREQADQYYIRALELEGMQRRVAPCEIVRAAYISNYPRRKVSP